MKDTSLRHLFPFFQHPQNAELIYFDNAATTQKPSSVLSNIQDFYLFKNANVHRSTFTLANQTTAEFEEARAFVRGFIGAKHKQEIVFTKGATESINLVAKSLAEMELPKRGRILVSATEHHANLVPWQILADKNNLKIDVIPINENGVWDVDRGLELLTDKTCIVAIALVSNALGSIQPVQPFLQKAKLFNTISLIDAAQAVAHIPINVQDLDCDFLVFSGHKAFAPTGTGVLYGKSDMLEKLPVFLTGGEMVERVEFDKATYQTSPIKFEAGTPNIEGVLALKVALEFILQNRDQIIEHEVLLLNHLIKQIQTLPNVRIYGDSSSSIATVSFIVLGIDSQDISISLAHKGIAVRVGHHCAMPMMNMLGVNGTIRVSLSCYNTIAEVDSFITQLTLIIERLQNTDVQNNSLTANVQQKADLTQQSETILANAVREARGWDQVFRQIMLAGKSLPRLPDAEKSEGSEVFGCESRVWLVCSKDTAKRLIFEVDASSKIIRGLLAILLEPIQHQYAEYVLGFDYKSYMSDIQLDKHLSETRGNGLTAVIERIKVYAKQNV